MEPPIPAGFAPSRLTLAVHTATRVLEQHFVCIVLNLEVCSSRQSTFGRGSSGVDLELQKSSTHAYTICAADHPKRRSWCWLAATYIRTKFVAHCTSMVGAWLKQSACLTGAVLAVGFFPLCLHAAFSTIHFRKTHTVALTQAHTPFAQSGYLSQTQNQLR